MCYSDELYLHELSVQNENNNKSVVDTAEVNKIKKWY